MIRFAPVRFDELSLRRYESLFLTCFLKSGRKFSPTVLNWLYQLNPDGCAIGYDAFAGDQLAAHYVCVPTTIRVNGKVEKALLSLNTATHPRCQGQGIFTQLAEMTYRAAAQQGYGSVYGVANANSTPGFVRKLGFQLVRPLQAMVGVGSLNIDFDIVSRNSQFERVWTPESLHWRCSNPINEVYCLHRSTRTLFHANAFGWVLSAYAELFGTARCPARSGYTVSPLRLFLGLLPDGASHFAGYAEIPHQLRPSPLNLIFRPLSSSSSLLDAGQIAFSFLDFDAY